MRTICECRVWVVDLERGGEGDSLLNSTIPNSYLPIVE